LLRSILSPHRYYVLRPLRGSYSLPGTLAFENTKMTAIDTTQKDTPIEGTASTHTQSSLSTLPLWFLENCVKTSAELKDREIPLVVRQTQFSEVPEDTQAAYSRRNAKKFEIESVIYDALNDILHSEETRAATSQTFRKDAIHMRFPGKLDKPGCDAFFQAVVESFARDIEADLVTITEEDLKDLAQHWSFKTHGHSKTVPYEDYMNLFVANCPSDASLDESDSDKECEGTVVPPARTSRDGLRSTLDKTTTRKAQFPSGDEGDEHAFSKSERNPKTTGNNEDPEKTRLGLSSTSPDATNSPEEAIAHRGVCAILFRHALSRVDYAANKFCISFHSMKSFMPHLGRDPISTVVVAMAPNG
jgi:hypothetical protein